MSEQQVTNGDSIHISIGNNAKNIAAGKDIHQTVKEQASIQVTDADLATIRKIFDDLKNDIEKEAPADLKQSAIERVEELQEAVTNEKPDLTTMGYVKQWFVKKLPQLAGKVIGVLVSPIVGKVVEAGGEIAATELKKRFGQKAP